MSSIYATPLEAIATWAHSEGWVRLPSGVWITKLPLVDLSGTRGITMARVNAAAAQAWAEARGWELPTLQEYDELHRLALHIDPVTLVYTAADLELMSSEAYCRRHDKLVWDRLVDVRWTGQPVANFGKHWAHDKRTEAGQGCLYGWWRKDGTKIQEPTWKHDAGREDNTGGQHDYATGAHVVSVIDPHLPLVEVA